MTERAGCNRRKDDAMTRRTRMEATSDLLADPAYGVEDVTLLALVHHEMVELVNESVAFELIAANLDRPNAEKYGTHPDGSPRYAPEWYVAQGIKTGIHEALYGKLRGVLSCEEKDEHGHPCIGSVLHESVHWDGNGCNWTADGLLA